MNKTFSLSRPFVNFLFAFVLLVSLFAVGVPNLSYSTADAAASAAVSAAATTRYVAKTGSDTATCGTASEPCLTIQKAISKANGGDTILIATGTYQESHTCSGFPINATICVQKNLTIKGGYNSANWSSPPSQDPLSTVIDGQNDHRGVGVNGGSVVLNMEDISIQNSAIREDGAYGGGMQVLDSTVHLKNMVFRKNFSYGNNRTSDTGGIGAGGGLAFVGTDGNNTLDNVRFENNESHGGTGVVRGGIAHGGGLYVSFSKVTGNYVTFTSNITQAGSSSGNGRAGNLNADALGGGASLQIGSTVTFNHLVAKGNIVRGGNAGTDGGGGFGGAVCAEKTALTITDADLEGNLAEGGVAFNGGLGLGGGLMTNATNATIDRIKVINNIARSGRASSSSGVIGSSGGGGIYLGYFGSTDTYTTNLTNAIITDNQADANVTGNQKKGGGGAGMDFHGVRANIKHLTLARNSFAGHLVTGMGFAVLSSLGTTGIPGSVNLSYSIISDHTVGPTTSTLIGIMQNSKVSLNYVLFAGNSIKDWSTTGSPLPTVQHRFDASSVSYVSPGSPNFNYHLKSGSPAIDKATGSTTTHDIDGDKRPYHGVSDLGADEYSAPSLSASPTSLKFLEDTRKLSQPVKINISSGSAVTWSAAANKTWLKFGSSGDSTTASGLTGTSLLVWADPAVSGIGTFDGTVTISGPSPIEDISVSVHLVRVSQLRKIFLPLAVR